MKIYLSHAIRGAKGEAATREDQAANCQKARMFAARLRDSIRRALTCGVGWCEVECREGLLVLAGYDTIYVPAEHEEFVQAAYNCGALSIEQILAIDCMIVSTCGALVAYGPVSPGMQVEIDYAVERNIPVYYVKE